MVLLCPRPLGLLAMGGTALSRFRAAFGNPMITHDDNVIQSNIWPYAFDGPSCVTFHPFHPSSEGICVVQNFNDRTADITVSLRTREGKATRFVERFTGTPIAVRTAESSSRVVLEMSIPARGRIWIQRIDEDTAK